MSAEAALLVHSFKVGRRTCTLTFPKPKPSGAIIFTADWEPDIPGPLSQEETHQYRAELQAAMREVLRLARIVSAGLVIED